MMYERSCMGCEGWGEFYRGGEQVTGCCVPVTALLGLRQLALRWGSSMYILTRR